MVKTLKPLIVLFLDWTAANRAAGTTAGYKRHLDAFAVAVGDVSLSDLRAYHLLEWGRTWHQIQAVQRLFNWAKNDAELIDRNPFTRVKKPTPRGRRRILSYHELAKLLRVSRRDFRELLIASRETLSRPQEVRTLAWEELRHDESAQAVEDALRQGTAYFELTEFKARKRRRDHQTTRVIPISLRLGRLLLRIRQRDAVAGGEVFRTFRGVPWSKERIRQRMRTARKRAGLQRDRAGETVCLYTLRHTMATRACARGVRDRVLADLLGHTTTRTTARYQHLEVPDLIEAMQVIHDKHRRRGSPQGPHVRRRPS